MHLHISTLMLVSLVSCACRAQARLAVPVRVTHLSLSQSVDSAAHSGSHCLAKQVEAVLAMLQVTA